MTDTENTQGMTRERATELVDAMGRTDLIEFVMEHSATVRRLIAESNNWADACHLARAERDADSALVEGYRSTITALHADIERLVDERLDLTRAIFAVLPENSRGVILDEHLDDNRESMADDIRENLKEELAEELRDDLREEVQTECAEELRDALNGLGWYY